MNDILSKLAAPFPPDKISWRVGSTTQDKSRGMALAYIDARDVQDRLDEVCGVLWQVRTPWSAGERIACEIGIKVGDEWLWRGDGAGATDVEADKGAFSDAFKRAAVRWGVGRYLYDLESPWVELKPAGRSYAIADHERERLRKLLAGKSAPPPRPAPDATKPPAAPAKKAPADPKAKAEAIAANIKAAPSLQVLDIVMDDTQQERRMFPQVTQNYLTSLYEKRREAMESAT